MSARSPFLASWSTANKIHDENDPIGRVKHLIGGKVKQNFEIPERKGGWVNTCAIRMSYVLNYTGQTIPYITGRTVSGSDGKWYFFRVKDVIDWLIRQWGKPDEIVNYPVFDNKSLLNKRGLILFEIRGWSDSAGHATFWNGFTCSDHCYFNEEGKWYTTTKANFWELP